MFIVKKKIGNNEYYYLRESERVGGKVKAKNIAYLGKTFNEAKKKMKEIIDKNKKEKTAKKPKNQKKTELTDKEKLKNKKIDIEELTKFCKRKGFVFTSGEIYGGLAGFWDFGPLGAELKKNIKEQWWDYHVRQRDDVVGIDGSIITHPKTWEASGHVESFSDIIVKCKKCKKMSKIDKGEFGKIRCGCGGEYKLLGEFNLMFTTQVGPIEGESLKSYLRPETAQLIFTNFKNVLDSSRIKLPFGIAQMGKAFRNEISPRDFLFRSREFEQMEIEYFISPKTKCPYKIGNTKILIYSDKMQEKNKEPVVMSFKQAYHRGIIKTDWHAYWLEQEYLWFLGLGADPKKFRIRQHTKDEKSHYALDTWDLEYEFPFGWKELEGMANRTDFDLSQHERFSKKELRYFDEETGGKHKKILPHVICEPSLGVERSFLVFLFDAYQYDVQRENIVLSLHPKLAPVKAAVFPIVKKKEFIKIAEDIFNELKKYFHVVYDENGSIGRRYARQDEIGTPYCIAIDGQTPKDKSVTIRNRDDTKQIRVKIKNLKEILEKLINSEIEFKRAGKIVETRVK